MLDNDNSQMSSDFIEKGVFAFDNRNWINAITYFDKAIEFNPNAVIAYQYRATCKCYLANSDNLSIPKRSYYLKGASTDFEQVKKLNDKIYNYALISIQNL